MTVLRSPGGRNRVSGGEPNDRLGGISGLTSVTGQAQYQVVSNADDAISVAVPAGGITVTLPPDRAFGDQYIIKDATGNCSGVNPIHVAGNGATIDNQATYNITHAFGALHVQWDGGNNTWIVRGSF